MTTVTTGGTATQVEHLLVGHLESTGLLGPARPSPASAIPLHLGLPEAVYDGAAGVLSVAGRTVRPTRRRLSQILPPIGVAFPGRDELQRHVAAGHDPVLYEAWRDILPPRRKHQPGSRALTLRHGVQDAQDFWFADLVAYRPGTLPDGQPYRSTGHYNTARQLEVFQTLTGRVVMLIAGHLADGTPYMSTHDCRPGDLTAVPAGAWHATYCLDGPALVLNIYTDQPGPRPGRSSRDGALDPALKYHQQAGPQATVHRSADGFTLAGPIPSGTQLLDVTSPLWLREALPEGTWLADHYLDGRALEVLAATEQSARTAGWPGLGPRAH